MSINIAGADAQEAELGEPVTIQLDREVDVSRGCVLSVDSGISVTSSVEATLLWMDDAELEEGKNYYVKLGTKLIPGVIKNILYTVDVNTGEKKEASSLKKNEIAECELVFADAIVVDLFAKHKTLGELILIDRVTNMTSACGVVTKLLADAEDSSDHVIDREARSNFKGQRALTMEFVAGRYGNTLEFVQKVEKELAIMGRHTYLYAPKMGEDVKLVVKHLNNAGILVLLYADDVDTSVFAENRSYVSGWQEDGLSAGEAARRIYKHSGIHSEDVNGGAFI